MGELPVNWSNIYEAYFPTVIRDIVYGIVRNYCTIWTLALAPSWKIQDPQVLFIVVILGCFGSAPFNEWRGFLLQSKGQELTFKEGLALAVGYWCAPPATKFVNGLFHAIRG